MILVIKHGVYMQEICGLYATLPEAVKEAKRFCTLEPDGYHYFLLLAISIGSEHKEALGRVRRMPHSSRQGGKISIKYIPEGQEWEDIPEEVE